MRRRKGVQLGTTLGTDRTPLKEPVFEQVVAQDPVLEPTHRTLFVLAGLGRRREKVTPPLHFARKLCLVHLVLLLIRDRP